MLPTLMVGSIASVRSSTIVNVAVPDLMRHVLIGQQRAQWVAAGFMAAMTRSMLPTPWLLARQGCRHTHVRAIGLLRAGGIGGVLVEHLGWRSIFFFVVPFALWALGLARRWLPVSAPGGGAPGGRGETLGRIGLGLAAAGVLGLLNGLLHLHDASLHTAAARRGTGALAPVLFVRHVSRTPKPLLDLRLFGSRPFAMGGVVAFVYGMGLFGST